MTLFEKVVSSQQAAAAKRAELRTVYETHATEFVDWFIKATGWIGAIQFSVADQKQWMDGPKGLFRPTDIRNRHRILISFDWPGGADCFEFLIELKQNGQVTISFMDQSFTSDVDGLTGELAEKLVQKLLDRIDAKSTRLDLGE